MFPPNQLPKPRVDAQPRHLEAERQLVSKGELHMSAVDPERRIAVLNESIQSYRCCLINMKVVTEGSSIARMPERHGGWSEFS